MPKRKVTLEKWEYGEIIKAEKINMVNDSIDEIWELIDNGDIGSGDGGGDNTELAEQVEKNTDDISKIMEIIDEPPTYTKPTLSLSLSTDILEHNATTKITITPHFNKNDGGDVISYTLQCGTGVVQYNYLTSYTYSATVKNGSSITFTATVNYGDGNIKNTALGNPYPDTSIKEGTISASTKITSYARTYYGAVSSNSLTANDINNLNSVVKSSKTGTYTVNLNNQRLVIIYPYSFGDLTSIKDANGFEYIQSYNKHQITHNGLLYYCYMMIDPVTITNFVQICK